ncbi:Hypothetical predicted protein [Lynx pardinus]|uniref:Uncharacterized protein n=1 Tax=Lynx pardinus TaxID=191816 RepID=A0A485MN97_LYNPA|nr:Hypothetical predicted protein [Lynx pardinus]
MENILFALRSISAGWLSSSLPSWTTETIFCFLCGLSFLLLLISCFQTDPTSSAPQRKRRSSRKARPGQTRQGLEGQEGFSQEVSAYRNCLQELEEVWDLVSLLRSHLGRLSDQGGLQQLLGQEAPGAKGKAAPAGAHQPRREPVRDAAPARAPPASPAPLASTLSPTPTTSSCNSMARPLDAVPRSPSPHTPWVASAIPAISGLGLSSCPISALSWWQAAAEAWRPSASTRLESWQEPHSHQHPEASFWGGPGNRQAEAGVLSFIGPDVQKLLEILITKKTELRFWKEKEKKEESGYHVNSLGSTFTSPRGGRAAVGYRSFRSMKGEPQQLLGPEQSPYPKISGDNLRLKCSQLFWGLPILHSESLVATVSVTGPPLESPSVVFNDLSHALPSQIQAGVASRLSLEQPFSHPVAEPQALTPSLSQSQPPPPAQVEARAHLAPSVPVGPPSLPPQMAGEASDPPIQNNTPSFIPNAIQNLERHFLKKQLERNRTLPSVVKRSQEVFSQVLPDFPQDSPASQARGPVSVLPFPSGDLTSPELQNHLEPHLGRRSTKQQGGGPQRIQPSVELAQPQGEPPKVPQAQSGSLQAAQETRSRGPARTTPGENLGKDAGPSVGRGRRDLHGSLISSSSKLSGVNSEGSHTGLMKTSGPGQNHPEQLLRAHLGRKLGQITEGQIPGRVHDPRLAASHGPDPPGKPSAHRETGDPAFSKHPEPRVNIRRDFSTLSPYTQQMLEAHIIRFRVRHRWGLPLKVLKPLNLFKLQKSSIFPPPSTPCSATRPPKAGAEAKFLEKPPEPHPGEKVITEESVLTLRSPLLDPHPAREEIQRAPGESPPGDGPRPSGAPVAGREAGLRPQTPAYRFVGRIWHSMTGAGAPQNSRLEVGEGGEAPAWGDTLEPGVLASNQSVKPDVRRSGSSGSSQGPSTPPASVARAQEGVEAQLEGFEPQGSVEPEEPQGPGRGVLLQDCETGVLLQDCATDDLLQDCHSDVLLVADVLASHRSPSGCQSESSTDTSTSWASSPFVSHAQNSRGQPDPLGRWGLRSPRSKASVHADDGREAYGRLSPGGREKWLAELKSFQASVMSHRAQEEDSAESSRSRFAQLLPKKENAAPEGHLRKSVRHLLQWIFPSKGKGPEDPGHRDQPAAATAQTQGPVSGTSVEDGKSAGAQMLMTAVGRILEENLVPRQRRRASEVNWRQREPQALAGTGVCYHRVLSYQEQRRVMRETACNLQATPDGHGCPNENRWCRGRDGRWAFVPRTPGSPDGPCHHGRMPARASGRPHRPHCPRHCLLQNYVSSGHSVCASHAFLGRTPFLQERMHTVQRKMYFSQVSTSSMG